MTTGQIEKHKVQDYYKDTGKQKILLKTAQEKASIEYLKLQEMDLQVEKEKLKQRRKQRKLLKT